MEWVLGEREVQESKVNNIELWVCPSSKHDEWQYGVTMLGIDDRYLSTGSTDTEDRAKRFAIYEAHRIIRDLVNDLAEITGENYHLELN